MDTITWTRLIRTRLQGYTCVLYTLITLPNLLLLCFLLVTCISNSSSNISPSSIRCPVGRQTRPILKQPQHLCSVSGQPFSIPCRVPMSICATLCFSLVRAARHTHARAVTEVIGRSRTNISPSTKFNARAGRDPQTCRRDGYPSLPIKYLSRHHRPGLDLETARLSGVPHGRNVG